MDFQGPSQETMNNIPERGNMNNDLQSDDDDMENMREQDTQKPAEVDYEPQSKQCSMDDFRRYFHMKTIHSHDEGNSDKDAESVNGMVNGHENYLENDNDDDDLFDDDNQVLEVPILFSLTHTHTVSHIYISHIVYLSCLTLLMY
jgi:hypothetical protein